MLNAVEINSRDLSVLVIYFRNRLNTLLSNALYSVVV